MSQRPNNWHNMTYDEQCAWERADQERQNLEYEHTLLQADIDRRLADAKHEISLAHQFLKEKGLYEEFDNWAAYRRYE